MVAEKTLIEIIKSFEKAIESKSGDLRPLQNKISYHITSKSDQVDNALIKYLSSKISNNETINKEVYAHLLLSSIKTNKLLIDNDKSYNAVRKIVFNKKLDFGVRSTSMQLLKTFFNEKIKLMKSGELSEVEIRKFLINAQGYKDKLSEKLRRNETKYTKNDKNVQFYNLMGKEYIRVYNNVVDGDTQNKIRDVIDKRKGPATNVKRVEKER